MKNDFVHRLVHALTKSEKRYFKLFSQLQPGPKNYLRLFEAMENTEEYNSKAIREKLNDSKINISYEKKYLAKMLMKSLKNFQDDSSALFNLGNKLLEVEILVNKGFNKEAILILDEAVNMATDNMRLSYLPLLLYRKGIIMRGSYNEAMDDTEVQQWEDGYKKGISLTALMAEFEILKGRVQKKYLKRNRTAKDLLELEEIMNSPPMKMHPDSLPFNAYILYLEIRARYLQMNGKDSHTEVIRMAELWEDQKTAQLAMPLLYMTSLQSAATAYADIGQLNKMQEVIKALQNAAVFDSKQELVKQRELLVLQFRFLAAKCVPGEATTWLNKNIKLLEALIKKLNHFHKYFFLYHIGMFYMAEGDAETALDYLKRVNSSTQAQPFVFYTYSLILTLAAYYDLGNYKLIPHLTNSAKRTLLRIDKFAVLEKAIFTGFNKMALTKTVKDKDHEIRNFEKVIAGIDHHGNPYYREMKMVINTWLTSKKEKKPMIYFMKPGNTGK